MTSPVAIQYIQAKGILSNYIKPFFTGNWSKIARALGDRTDNQCWRRWIVLRKDDVSFVSLRDGFILLQVAALLQFV